MDISRKKLEELTRHRNEENPVVSLYLNVTPPRDFKAELNSLIHTTLHSIEDRYNKEQLKGLGQVFTRLEEYVKTALDKSEDTRLVVIFADNDGFWEENHLPVAVPSRTVVESHPYVRPLSVLLDKFNQYCVLVTDSNKARFFTLYLDKFREDQDVSLKDEVPDRVRVHRSMTESSSYVQGLGDEAIRSHIQDHIQHHMKNVADRAFEYYKKTGFNRLIIGGLDSKGNRWLKDHLHSYLKARLVGEFNASPTDPEEDLKKKAEEVAAEHERQNEKDLINRLFDKKGKNMGVVGTEPVIEALMSGQVHTLFIDYDFRTEGFVCARDHVLSTYIEKCPVCGEGMEKTKDLAEEMVEEALYQNSEVKYVFMKHEDFDYYKVGAILRFSV